MSAMPRPTVNLDALGQAIDRAIQTPLGIVTAAIMPEAFAKLRTVRDNLPEVASGLETRAVGVVKGELAELERGMIAGLDDLLSTTRRRAVKRSKAKRSKPKRLKR